MMTETVVKGKYGPGDLVSFPAASLATHTGTQHSYGDMVDFRIDILLSNTQAEVYRATLGQSDRHARNQDHV